MKKKYLFSVAILSSCCLFSMEDDTSSANTNEPEITLQTWPEFINRVIPADILKLQEQLHSPNPKDRAHSIQELLKTPSSNIYDLEAFYQIHNTWHNLGPLSSCYVNVQENDIFHVFKTGNFAIDRKNKRIFLNTISIPTKKMVAFKRNPAIENEYIRNDLYESVFIGEPFFKIQYTNTTVLNNKRFTTAYNVNDNFIIYNFYNASKHEHELTHIIPILIGGKDFISIHQDIAEKYTLFDAAYTGNIKIIQNAITKKINLEEEDNRFFRISLAFKNAQDQICTIDDLLLKKSLLHKVVASDIQYFGTNENDDRTPLGYAARGKQWHIIKLLHESKAAKHAKLYSLAKTMIKKGNTDNRALCIMQRDKIIPTYSLSTDPIHSTATNSGNIYTIASTYDPNFTVQAFLDQNIIKLHTAQETAVDKPLPLDALAHLYALLIINNDKEGKKIIQTAPSWIHNTSFFMALNSYCSYYIERYFCRMHDICYGNLLAFAKKILNTISREDTDSPSIAFATIVRCFTAHQASSLKNASDSINNQLSKQYLYQLLYPLIESDVKKQNTHQHAVKAIGNNPYFFTGLRSILKYTYQRALLRKHLIKILQHSSISPEEPSFFKNFPKPLFKLIAHYWQPDRAFIDAVNAYPLIPDVPNSSISRITKAKQKAKMFFSFKKT